MSSVRTLLASLLLVNATIATAAELTIERFFAAPDLRGPTPRALKFAPDGRSATYLQGAADDKDRLDLWAFDLKTRKARLLVDARQLVPKEAPLSAEEEARRERKRISSLTGIVEYEFSPDSRALLFPLGGNLYYYDLTARPEKAVRQITNSDAAETDAHFSPLGRYVSYVRNQNLYVYELATGRERQLTTAGGGAVSYGMADFIAQEEMHRSTGYWWSPDDSRIAYARVDESPVAELERFEIMAEEVRVVKQRYPVAGAANALVTLEVAELASDRRSAIDLGANTDIYLARVDWFPDSRHLLVQRQSRDQQQLDLIKADADTGTGPILFSEKSSTWIDLNDDLTFLPKRQQFLWSSQRSGYSHLYLYDFDGHLVRQVTDGPWLVIGAPRAVAGVDEKEGTVWFTGSHEGHTERQLYSASLDKGDPANPKRVTRLPGWHTIDMSRDTQHFIDSFSSVTQPPQVGIYGRDGERLAWLIENRLDANHPYAPYLAAHPKYEFGTLAASDGSPLSWVLIKPRDFDPARRYPVIVQVYGGPQGQMVQNAWDDPFTLFFARHGYLVYAIDNRGSARQGVKADGALYLHMAGVEVEDQIRGAQYLASLPYVDPARIGVFGWSYGGYMALHMIMRAPQLFHAAVSGAPVTDWRLYDTHYTERYMGKPQDNAAGYLASSVFPYVGQLAGPLLVMHGMADDNVLFSNSTMLFRALQEQDKQFDIMVYPGHKHSLVSHADVGPHAMHTIVRFLDTALQPQQR